MGIFGDERSLFSLSFPLFPDKEGNHFNLSSKLGHSFDSCREHSDFSFNPSMPVSLIVKPSSFTEMMLLFL